MKNHYSFSALLLLITVLLAACSKPEPDKTQEAIKAYLKAQLKDPASYEPVSFSGRDSLSKHDTSEKGQVSVYKITHSYNVMNSSRDKVKMNVTFYLGKDLQINRTDPKGINGDYGGLAGTITWEFNTSGGHQPDEGAELVLFPMDTAAEGKKYTATVDKQGQYKIEKILPGAYFMMVRSKHAINCPEQHLRKLAKYSVEMKQVFGFDIGQYKTQTDEIAVLENSAREVLMADNILRYGSLNKMLEKYAGMQKEMRDRVEQLIMSFPENFRREIMLSDAYGPAYYFNTIQVSEGNPGTQDADLGTACVRN